MLVEKRLEYIIKQINITQSNFANSIGSTASTISRQLNGITQIDKQVALSIQAVYNINPDWLLTGEGEMFLSSPQGGYTPPPDPTAQLKGKDKESAREYIDYLKDKPQFKEYIADKQEFKEWLEKQKQVEPELPQIQKIDIKKIEEEVKYPHGRMAELYHVDGRVAAGTPSEIFEEEPRARFQVDRLLLKNSRTKELFSIEVKGDSMEGAGIYEDNIIILQPVYSASDIRHRDIVLARIEGALTLKRILKKRKPHVLHAENPDYKDIELNSEKHVILGRAIGQYRSDFR